MGLTIKMNPRTLYETYIGRPLCGIYNVVDNSIVLYPCVSKRIQLWEDNQKVFIKGIEIDNKDSKIAILTAKELLECNQLKYAPRFINLPSGQLLSTHEYVTRMMGITDKKALANLRGFTVTQKDLTSPPVFDWKSGSLNSPRNEDGHFTKGRIRGCEMASSQQNAVKQIITSWSEALKPAPKPTKQSKDDLILKGKALPCPKGIIPNIWNSMPPLMKLFYNQYQGNNANDLRAHIIHCYETRFDQWANQAHLNFFKNPVENLKGSKIPFPKCIVPIERVNSANGTVTQGNLEDIVLNLDDPKNPFNPGNNGTLFKVVDPQQPSQLLSPG